MSEPPNPYELAASSSWYDPTSSTQSMYGPPAPVPPKRNKALWWSIGGISGAVILCCILGAAALAANGGGNSRSVTSTMTARSATSYSLTATAGLPTATPTGPHLLAGAILGGKQDGFTAAYGEPTMTGPTAHYTFTLSDGTLAAVCVCGTATGLDGAQHVEFLKIGPASSTQWSVATRLAAAKLFLPPDAVYVRTINDPNVGPIHVYQSGDLAKTFPASEFTDSIGGPAPPVGTFSVLCQQPGISDCSVLTGT